MTIPHTPNTDLLAVTVTGHAATCLVELLDLCDQFLRTAGPAVHAELLAFLADQPTRPDLGWLIDMLGFNALYLQGKLAIAGSSDTKDTAGTHVSGGHR